MTSEGTLYPLLSRMRREGLVGTQWQESPTGPPGKYYHLTAEGERAVADLTAAWQTFQAAVAGVISGDISLPRTQSVQTKSIQMEEAK